VLLFCQAGLPVPWIVPAAGRFLAIIDLALAVYASISVWILTEVPAFPARRMRLSVMMQRAGGIKHAQVLNHAVEEKPLPTGHSIVLSSKILLPVKTGITNTTSPVHPVSSIGIAGAVASASGKADIACFNLSGNWPVRSVTVFCFWRREKIIRTIAVAGKGDLESGTAWNMMEINIFGVAL
jgi:hypothetical protein